MWNVDSFLPKNYKMKIQTNKQKIQNWVAMNEGRRSFKKILVHKIPTEWKKSSAAPNQFHIYDLHLSPLVDFQEESEPSAQPRKVIANMRIT